MQIQVHVHLWSFFGYAQNKELYFVQQGWARLVEMTEGEREK